MKIIQTNSSITNNDALNQFLMGMFIIHHHYHQKKKKNQSNQFVTREKINKLDDYVTSVTLLGLFFLNLVCV